MTTFKDVQKYCIDHNKEVYYDINDLLRIIIRNTEKGLKIQLMEFSTSYDDPGFPKIRKDIIIENIYPKKPKNWWTHINDFPKWYQLNNNKITWENFTSKEFNTKIPIEKFKSNFV